VWWIDAEKRASISDQFAALAIRLGLDPATDPEVIQAQVHDRLRGGLRWLLIFDHADSVKDIQPWLPAGPLPLGVSGHVIITTQRGGFAALGRVVNLDVIAMDNAVQLLRTRLADLEEDTAEKIAEELGRLPLALEQAAAYMDVSEMPCREYLELLRTRASDMHKLSPDGSREGTIATLWDISLDRVRTESPSAFQLLAVCSYLGTNPIPLGLFFRHPDLLPEPLSSAAADKLTFSATVAVLADYSLAKRTIEGLEVHRLIQATMRAHFNGAVPSLNTLQGDVYRLVVHPLTIALNLLRAELPGRIMEAPEAWQRWAVLLPHVLAAAGHCDGTPGIQNPAASATDTAWLLDRAGIYLQVHGRLTDARPLLERALTITETALGPDHPAVATDLNNLALILRDLGQPQAAQPLLERALTITETALGPDHPAVATDLNNLALILRDLGQPQAAQPLLEQALTITETALGPDHPAVAAHLNNLAAIRQDLGHPKTARPLLERAITIDAAAYGSDHPAVATDVENIRLNSEALGQPPLVRALRERALAIDVAAYSPEFPEI
jgi:tetratricopeptide (TPR) repeat protein